MRQDAEPSGDRDGEFLHWILSDEYIVLTKLRNYRAELQQPCYDGPRALLESQSRELCRLIEEMDRSVRAAGGQPLGRLKDFLDHARLKDPPGGTPDIRWMYADLLQDHESLLQRLGPRPRDRVLADVARGHERMAWTLRTLLHVGGAHAAVH